MNRTLAIIPAALRETVNGIVASHPAFPAGTPEEFSVPLYAADDEVQETPTHYWLSHPFTENQRAAVGQLAAAFPSAIVEDYTDPEFPRAKLEALELKTKTSTMV